MFIDVYHVKRNAPRGTAFHEHPESWDERKEHYKRVATVRIDLNGADIDARDVAFRATQTDPIAESTIPDEVDYEVVSVEKHRSTSVGDVFFIYDLPHEVGKVGFRPIIGRNEKGTMERDRELFEIGA